MEGEPVIIKRTVRRRRVVVPEATSSHLPEPSVETEVGAEVKMDVEAPPTMVSKGEFLEAMTTIFKGRTKDLETGRYSVEGVRLPEGAPMELFHAFGVAHDVLETSYRPLECNYSRRK